MKRAPLLLLALACGKKEDAPIVDASRSILDVGFVHAFSPAPEDAGPALFDAGDPSTVTGSRPKAAKSVGHTSVVFKVRLENGNDVCFKPESKRGKTRYRGEIGAYRLAVLLGLRNVIPAMYRTFNKAELRAALEPQTTTSLFDEEVIARGGEVRGAAMQWLAKMEFIPLESASWRARWGAWLGAGDIPEDQRAIAAQISNMIVFDLLTGNWDRWSGANVAIDRPTSTLLYVDNDGALFDPVPAQPLAQQTKLLEKTARFSRAFVAALRKIDPASLADAMGEETPGVPLFAPSVLAGVMERRKRALDRVDALIEERGEATVLFFP